MRKVQSFFRRGLAAMLLVLMICPMLSLTALADDDKGTDTSFYAMSSTAATYASDAIASSDKKLPDSITPGTAGGFLGYSDKADESGVIEKWIHSALSNSAITYSYNSLSDVGVTSGGFLGTGIGATTNKTNAFYEYAKYGQCLNKIGFDRTGKEGRTIQRTVAGGALKIAVWLADLTPVLFKGITNVMLTLNPFRLINPGDKFVPSMRVYTDMNTETGTGTYTTPGSVPEYNNGFYLSNETGMMQGGGLLSANTGLAAAAQLMTQIYATIEKNLVPIILTISFTWFAVTMLFSNMNRGGDKSGGNMKRVKKFLLRLLVMVLGVPLCCALYTDCLVALNADFSGGSYASSRVIMSTLFDFETWVRANHLGIPANSGPVYIGITHVSSLNSAKDGSGVPQVWSTAARNLRNTCYNLNMQNWLDSGKISVLDGVSFMTDNYDDSFSETQDWNNTVQGSDINSSTIKSVVDDMLNRYTNAAMYQASSFESDAKSALSGGYDSVADTIEKTSGKVSKFERAMSDGKLLETDPLWGKAVMKRTVSNREDFTINGSLQQYEKYSPKNPSGGAAVSDGGYTMKFNEAGGLSTMAMYNYLNSTFGDTNVIVYSDEKSSSGMIRDTHYSVNLIGGDMVWSFLVWLNAFTTLIVLAIIGICYAMAIMFNNIKRLLLVIPGCFGMGLGSLRSFGRVLTHIVVMIIEFVGTMLMYAVVTELCMSINDLMTSPFLQGAKAAGTGATAVGIYALGFTGGQVVCILLLFAVLFQALFCWVAIKARRALVRTMDEWASETIDKLLDLKHTPYGGGSGGGVGSNIAEGVGAGIGAAMSMGANGGSGSEESGDARGTATADDNANDNAGGDGPDDPPGGGGGSGAKAGDAAGGGEGDKSSGEESAHLDGEDEAERDLEKEGAEAAKGDSLGGGTGTDSESEGQSEHGDADHSEVHGGGDATNPDADSGDTNPDGGDSKSDVDSKSDAPDGADKKPEEGDRHDADSDRQGGDKQSDKKSDDAQADRKSDTKNPKADQKQDPKREKSDRKSGGETSGDPKDGKNTKPIEGAGPDSGSGETKETKENKTGSKKLDPKGPEAGDKAGCESGDKSDGHADQSDKSGGSDGSDKSGGDASGGDPRQIDADKSAGGQGGDSGTDTGSSGDADSGSGGSGDSDSSDGAESGQKDVVSGDAGGDSGTGSTGGSDDSESGTGSDSGSDADSGSESGSDAGAGHEATKTVSPAGGTNLNNPDGGSGSSGSGGSGGIESGSEGGTSESTKSAKSAGGSSIHGDGSDASGGSGGSSGSSSSSDGSGSSSGSSSSGDSGSAGGAGRGPSSIDTTGGGDGHGFEKAPDESGAPEPATKGVERGDTSLSDGIDQDFGTHVNRSGDGGPTVEHGPAKGPAAGESGHGSGQGSGQPGGAPQQTQSDPNKIAVGAPAGGRQASGTESGSESGSGASGGRTRSGDSAQRSGSDRTRGPGAGASGTPGPQDDGSAAPAFGGQPDAKPQPRNKSFAAQVQASHAARREGAQVAFDTATEAIKHPGKAVKENVVKPAKEALKGDVGRTIAQSMIGGMMAGFDNPFLSGFGQSMQAGANMNLYNQIRNSGRKPAPKKPADKADGGAADRKESRTDDGMADEMIRASREAAERRRQEALRIAKERREAELKRIEEERKKRSGQKGPETPENPDKPDNPDET